MTYVHCWWLLTEFFLNEKRIKQTKGIQKIKINILFLINVCENRVVYGIKLKHIVQSDRPHVNAWQLRLQAGTQIMQQFFHFHCNSGYTNAPQYDIIRTLTLLWQEYVWNFISDCTYVFGTSLATHNFNQLNCLNVAPSLSMTFSGPLFSSSTVIRKPHPCPSPRGMAVFSSALQTALLSIAERTK
jgi:hypothetical protein